MGRFKDAYLSEPNRAFGASVGAVYVLLGAIGFAVTDGLSFAARRGEELIAFELNPLHNLVHGLVGFALLGGALAGPRIAAATNGAIGAIYLALGLAGFALVGTTANVLALNPADNGLHLLTGAFLVGFALRRPLRSYLPDLVASRVEEGRPARDELGVLRPGEAVPVSGRYRCEKDLQELSLERGTTVPPCPRDDVPGGAEHRFSLVTRAAS